MAYSSACEQLAPAASDQADPATRLYLWRTLILKKKKWEMGEFLDGNSHSLISQIESRQKKPGRRANPKSRSGLPLAEVIYRLSMLYSADAARHGFELPIHPGEWA